MTFESPCEEGEAVAFAPQKCYTSAYSACQSDARVSRSRLTSCRSVMANLLVVFSFTALNRLAEQICGFIRQDESVVLMALGTGSVFMAVTAIGVARFQLGPDHLDVVFVTELCDLDEDGHQRSALRVCAYQPHPHF